MHEPRLIWKLGKWIARRESGAARLAWNGGEIVLRVREGRVRSIDGVDAAQLAQRLNCESAGCRDLLLEARAIARRNEMPETQAVGTAKELMQQAIQSWLLDPGRELEIVEGDPGENDGPSISITHAIVELILSDVDQAVANQVLPDHNALVRRAPSFLELYAPLRLSEEADLVVSRISGERTATEIADSSPHGRDEVMRLLAALVATGMLEPSHNPINAANVEILGAELPEEDPPRRTLPIAWIVTAVAVLAAALGIFGFMTRSESPTTTPEPIAASAGHHWALVVDMGCEPEEFQRILRKAQEHPKMLNPVQAEELDGQPCWRLVWGSFTTRQEAEAELASLPDSVRRDGFEPHAVEVPDQETPVSSDLATD